MAYLSQSWGFWGTKSYMERRAEYPVWFPFKTLRVRNIHRDRAGCRGYSIVPLVFFSQSTVFSKRGYV